MFKIVLVVLAGLALSGCGDYTGEYHECVVAAYGSWECPGYGVVTSTPKETTVPTTHVRTVETEAHRIDDIYFDLVGKHVRGPVLRQALANAGFRVTEDEAADLAADLSTKTS